MERYSVIRCGGFPREFVLLQGTGCRWRRCTFCDYHDDRSPDPFSINKEVLEKVTGEYGTLDIINSGSAVELDEKTLGMIREIVSEKNIGTLWFEMHYMYRNLLDGFARRFAPAVVKFRCGIESFDPDLRNRWEKGIPSSVTAEEVSRYFRGVCLLCCTEGDSRERIIRDIRTAKKYFEYCSINLFCNNSTREKRDEKLAEWFVSELYPKLKDDPQIEILIGNTDLGVG